MTVFAVCFACMNCIYQGLNGGFHNVQILHKALSKEHFISILRTKGFYYTLHLTKGKGFSQSLEHGCGPSIVII